MCTLCVTYVSRLDAVLTNETADREIASIASRACNKWDGKQQQQCVAIIETFGPYFLQMIGRLNNPRQVCKAVDLCLSGTEVHLLGGHKCKQKRKLNYKN